MYTLTREVQQKSPQCTRGADKLPLNSQLDSTHGLSVRYAGHGSQLIDWQVHCQFHQEKC